MMRGMPSPFSRKRPSESEPDAPAPKRGKRSTQDMIDENKGPGFVVSTLRTLAGLAVALLIGAAVWLGAAAIEGDDPSPLAPWNESSAPDVAPSTLDDQ